MMMENKMIGKIPAINEVDGFDPAAFTRSIANEDGTVGLYLDVKYRMLWFRLCYPKGKIDTEVLKATDQYAIVSCKIYMDKSDPVDQFISKSVAQRYATGERYGDRFLETAETASIGRALAAAGFGTQFCSCTDIPTDIADAPVDKSLQMPAVNDSVVKYQDSHEEDKCSRNSNAVATDKAVAAQSAQQSGFAQNPTMDTAGSNAPYTAKASGAAVSEDTMTVDDAKKVIVDFGRYKGSTLGQIAMINPKDLQWYVEHYNGPNKRVKRGATLLVRAAQEMAC